MNYFRHVSKQEHTMSHTPKQGKYAAKLEAAQLQAIHELRGEPPDDGWQAAGLLASAHAVSRVAAPADGGLWQPTGDETLCFFIDLLELGGCVSVLLTREFLADADSGALVVTLKQTARAMLALQRAQGGGGQ